MYTGKAKKYTDDNKIKIRNYTGSESIRSGQVTKIYDQGNSAKEQKYNTGRPTIIHLRIVPPLGSRPEQSRDRSGTVPGQSRGILPDCPGTAPEGASRVRAVLLPRIFLP